MRGTTRTIIVSSLLLTSAVLQAQSGVDRPKFAEDGSVSVPAFILPPSPFLSPEALNQQKLRARMPVAPPIGTLDVKTARQAIEAALGPQAQQARKRYPVTIEEQKIGGVPVRVITPEGKAFDRKKILINLHGGGFSMCADACSIIESAPVAALGGFKVVSVNYRQAPEAQHPAAIEDVASVYRELLKTHRPSQIGIFGCSAGGALTGQTAAWLPAHGLPQAGAIGIFGAGALITRGGDSRYFSGFADGTMPPPEAEAKSGDMTRGYFSKTDPHDPIASPALHPEILRRFPPALIITGTRAYDLSPAVVTNSALIKAGVRSTMIVGEGLGHCYIYDPNLPEAQDAQRAIANFFREMLH